MSCGSKSPESRAGILHPDDALSATAAFPPGSSDSNRLRRYRENAVRSLPGVDSEPDPDHERITSAERRNLADALAHERNVLRTMIDLIPAFIYAKDAHSRFTASNKLVPLAWASRPKSSSARRTSISIRARWRRSSSPTNRR